MGDLPEVIAAYVAAYNGKDVEVMIACLAEEVVFRNLSGGVVTAETAGRPDFETLARHGAAAFATRRQTVTHAITVAGTTLAEIDYGAVVAADLPNGWVAGQAAQLSGATLFRVREGRIVEIVDQS